MTEIVRRIHVVVLCTGNICRSPIAAAALRSSLPTLLVTSAGLRTQTGMLADQRSIEAARRVGLDISRHRSTIARADALSRADLVLTMTASHALSTQSLCFEAGLRAPRVATLRAAAWRSRSLANGDVYDDEWLDLLSGVRVAVSNTPPPWGTPRAPTRPGADDIEDPIGRAASVHRRVANEIIEAVGELAGNWRA